LMLLRLRSNKIKTLPESIGQLINLEYINVEDNQLSILPDSIGQVKSLKKTRACHQLSQMTQETR